MVTSLADALGQLDLKAGHVYECQVGDLQVEVRVKPNAPNLFPTELNPSDVMLDAWTDLPAPGPATLLQATAGGSVLPDVPDIPKDWKEE